MTQVVRSLIVVPVGAGCVSVFNSGERQEIEVSCMNIEHIGVIRYQDAWMRQPEFCGRSLLELAAASKLLENSSWKM